MSSRHITRAMIERTRAAILEGCRQGVLEAAAAEGYRRWQVEERAKVAAAWAETLGSPRIDDRPDPALPTGRPTVVQPAQAPGGGADDPPAGHRETNPC